MTGNYAAAVGVGVADVTTRLGKIGRTDLGRNQRRAEDPRTKMHPNGLWAAAGACIGAGRGVLPFVRPLGLEDTFDEQLAAVTRTPTEGRSPADHMDDVEVVCVEDVLDHVFGARSVPVILEARNQVVRRRAIPRMNSGKPILMGLVEEDEISHHRARGCGSPSPSRGARRRLPAGFAGHGMGRRRRRHRAARRSRGALRDADTWRRRRAADRPAGPGLNGASPIVAGVTSPSRSREKATCVHPRYSTTPEARPMDVPGRPR